MARFVASICLILCLGSCAHTRPAPAPIEYAATAAFDQARQAATSPAAARALLEEGNARFVAGRLLARDHHAAARATAAHQYPFAAILSCIDSRVPPELIFDRGIGDLFVGRVAGNVVNDDLLASLEYATKVAGARLVVVLGHRGCGAVKAACEGVDLGHLRGLLEQIEPAIAAVGPAPEHPGKDPAFLAEVTRANVEQGVSAITARSPLIAELVGAGEVAVVGAVYDLESGVVTWLGDPR